MLPTSYKMKQEKVLPKRIALIQVGFSADTSFDDYTAGVAKIFMAYATPGQSGLSRIAHPSCQRANRQES